MNDNYCFSMLALMPKYQLLAKSFAKDLEEHSPDIMVVIGTDNPNVFQNCRNVFAFKLIRQGILHCYNDKRFVIEKALTRFKLVIQIDADTRIAGSLPKVINHSPGLAAIHIENLVSHNQKYNPERLSYLYRLADKLKINPDDVSYIGESLFSISVDQEKASVFIHQWDLIARYLEMHGIHAGEGNAIGLAAAKAKLEISRPSWLENINQIRQHMDVSQWERRKSMWDRFKQKVDYHYRLNKTRVIALKDFDFYYH
jgi:hypothetical protein